MWIEGGWRHEESDGRVERNVVYNITSGEAGTPRWAKLARSMNEEIITDLHCIDLGNLK